MCGADVRSVAIDSFIATSDTRTRRGFSLLVLSARHCRIIDPGQFFTGVPPSERRGGRGEFSPE